MWLPGRSVSGFQMGQFGWVRGGEQRAGHPRNIEGHGVQLTTSVPSLRALWTCPGRGSTNDSPAPYWMPVQLSPSPEAFFESSPEVDGLCSATWSFFRTAYGRRTT
jgi:hypothetical protein